SVESDRDKDDQGEKFKKPGILASLRYFNSRDIVFDDVNAYFITANVVKVLDSDSKGLPNIASPDLTNDDYSLVGDIVSVS
ncbi:hypothetical protein B0H34DRAFT_615622, partial [Crassisporium funariophilum]